MRLRIAAILVSSFLVASMDAQIGLRPDFFIEQTAPTNTNFEVYSQKSGLSRRASLANLKKPLSPFVTDTVDYIPAATGNLTDLASFVWDTTGLLWYIDGEGDGVSFSAGGGTSNFDGDRAILRVPEAGDNLGTSTVTDWLEWWYFVAPTISISSMSSPVEVGTSTTYNVSGSTTNPGGSTLSNGLFRQTSPSAVVLASFGSATSYADTILFTPQQGGSGQFNELTYTFQARQDWAFGSESGTATSSSRTITGVYPILYGMSATDLSSTGNPYTALTKLVQAEGNKTVTLTGSGFIFYAVPKTWGDFTLSSIVDHNGFNVTPSFTAYDITVSSSGLTNNWSTVAYKLYKLNTTTITAGYAYTFNR